MRNMCDDDDDDDDGAGGDGAGVETVVPIGYEWLKTFWTKDL